jgi:YebC/PmpR family DNA-binding regulatory protein
LRFLVDTKEKKEGAMSGHSKWSTIKHKKGRADAARGRLFTRLIKEVTIAARMGGGSEESNPRLRSAVATAKANNMPSDNITRAIKKGTGELEGVSYDEITYEGYGPEGVAILVECLTDSKNRCVSEVRQAFSKHNGKMAEPGAVAWVFNETGRVIVEGEVDEEQLMEVALEAGAGDFESDEGSHTIFCATDAIEAVREACEAAGWTVTEAGRIKVPSNTVEVSGRPAVVLMKLLSALEDLDDTQDLWANFEMDDSLLESLA